MKNILSIIIFLTFVLLGISNAFKQKSFTKALTEAESFVRNVKNQLRYQNAAFNEIYESAIKENYNFIICENGTITLKRTLNINVNSLFLDFVRKIGTTDETGQLSLCDEYGEKFGILLKEQRLKEKEKIQVNASLSFLGGLCVLIFFL